MGGSKSQVVGYWYVMDMHLVFTHGPVDKLMNISWDHRIAWSGEITDVGDHVVNNLNLFGGDAGNGEGGVLGTFEFLPGHPDQAQNAYLMQVTGDANLSAFRYVSSLIFKQTYMGMNPYLKPSGARLQRIHLTTDGAEQWHDTHSAIVSYGASDLNICFVLDQSGSMLDPVAGTTRMELQKQGVIEALQAVGDELLATNGALGIVGFGTTSGGAPLLFTLFIDSVVSSSQIDDAVDFINSLVIDAAHNNTDWAAGMQGVADFWNDVGINIEPKSVIFTTDGLPARIGATSATITAEAVAIRDTIPNIELRVVNIDVSSSTYSNDLDNLATTVPSVNSEDDDAITQAVLDAIQFTGFYDMNPAHMIRECLTDPDWGMGYLAADMDDATFEAAANQLSGEGMGMSLLWDREMKIQDYVNEIIRHINAALYISRSTGLFVLKLIRDDYDIEDLIVLNEEDIISMEGFGFQQDGLVNSVSGVGWDMSTGNDLAITKEDPALVMMQGGVINTTMQYPGFTNARNLERVIMRDLRTLSTPLRHGTIVAFPDKTIDLNPGDPFVLDWPKFGADLIVLRVGGMTIGDGKKNAVRLQAVQDQFGLPELDTTTIPDSEAPDPAPAPIPVEETFVIEAPYYELVQRTSKAAVDADLAANEEAGYLLATGVRPMQALVNMVGMADSGAGYEDFGTVDFMPAATIDGAMTKLTTGVVLEDQIDLDLTPLIVGTHCQIDTEIMEIVSYVSGTLTVKRGVLDTVPREHADGARVYFWDQYAASSDVQYVDGESVDVKLLPRGNGLLTIEDATAETVVFNSRAIRPYAPGNVKVDGTDWPTVIAGSFEVEWAHRNRLTQADTLVDTSEASVTPEASQRYGLRFENEATDALIVERNDLAGPLVVVQLGASAPATVRMRLKAISNNGASWQEHVHEFAFSGGAGSAVITGDPYDPYGPGGIIVDGGEVGEETPDPPDVPDPPSGGNDNPGAPTARAIGPGLANITTLTSGTGGADDNSSDINDAVQSLVAGGGGIVRLPANIGGAPWYVDTSDPILLESFTQLDLKTNNVTLQAANTTTTTTPFIHRDMIRVVDSVEETEVKGGKLIGYRAFFDASPKGTYGVGEWAHAIFVGDGAHHFTVSDCTMEKCVADGVSFGYTSHHVEVDNCIIRNNRRQGISEGGDYFAFTNNKISYIDGTSPMAGIDLEADNANGAQHGEVSGNTISNCKGPALLCYLKSEDLSIHNNIFETSSMGTSMVGSFDGEYYDNFVRYNRGYGLSGTKSSHTWNIHGNKFWSNRTTTYTKVSPEGTGSNVAGQNALTAKHLKFDSTCTAITVGTNNYGP